MCEVVMANRTLYGSAARTATPAAVTFDMRRHSNLRLYLVATAITATPSIVVTVDVRDPASATWVNVLTSAAITTVSTNVLTLLSGLSGTVRVTVTHGDADSITYSVGAHLS